MGLMGVPRKHRKLYKLTILICIKRVSALFSFITGPYQTEMERPAAKNKHRWRCHIIIIIIIITRIKYSNSYVAAFVLKKKLHIYIYFIPNK